MCCINYKFLDSPYSRKRAANMVQVNNIRELDYEKINISGEWNEGDVNELTMHTIHSYPAKFPAFVASKAFKYAQKEGVQIHKVSDIFCGCGTVALEAKIRGYNFWGCDINPVATLIAKTKSSSYDCAKVEQYFSNILESVRHLKMSPNLYQEAHERLKYWYSETNYCDLYKLYYAINTEVTEEKYREAFKCIFSSILKACSKWLTKSIKPQVDPRKKEIDVIQQFERQMKKFMKALTEIELSNTQTTIKCTNFLNESELPSTDLIITSPPYVTSYEYADLHQLSSLWLGYSTDYRELRKGSIGSVYNSDDFTLDIQKLNDTGNVVVEALKHNGTPISKVKSVARYYTDMQDVVKRCQKMLSNGGMIFFVVGDTEYKGVKILNSKHLIESLIGSGFQDIKIGKRTISKRICIPYRDEKGKFSKDKSKRKVYHEEFIISGRLWG